MYRIFRALTIAILLLTTATTSALAAPGDLDPTFGVGGFATAPTNATFPSTGAEEIALTASGQILAAGSLYDAGAYSISVQRFNPDGSIDSSFGDGGLATAALPAGTAINAVTGVGAQPDGSVVVGARVYPTTPINAPGLFAVIRFTSSGQLDPTFDGDSVGNGILMLNIGPPGPPAPSETARKLIVEPSGKIVMSGESYYEAYMSAGAYSSLAIGRLNVDGTWDSSFSGDGKLSIPFTTTDLDFRALADVPGDAGYVMGGRVLPGGGPTITQPTLVRITEGGALDTSFIGGAGNHSPTPGIVTYYWSADNTQLGEINTVAPAPGGGFVAGGYQNTHPDPSTYATFMGLARYTATGALDTSFGTSGVRLLQIGGGGSAAYDLAVQPDGKTLGGLAGVDSNTGFVGRFNTDGSTDAGYGSSGLVNPSALNASRIELQPDGKLVVSVARSGQANTTLMRLLPDPPATSSRPIDPPTATVTSPKSKSMKASKLHLLSGTAGPSGSVKSVKVALQRKDSKALKKKRRCYWMKGMKAKFKSVKATKGRCSKPYYLSASGTNSWKYRVTRTLPKGSYVLTVRVTLLDGRTGLFKMNFRLK
ncbi:MAG: delta-60 repeat domain-containing protein [Solirubrobacterales bacterium]